MGQRTERVVFLDRDGVINEDSANFIRSIDEWRPIPGSLDAIVRLSRAAYSVVVVTNQSGVDRGLIGRMTLSQIHDLLRRSVEALGGRVDAIYFCPHRSDQGCGCRKPETGLLERAERELGLHARNAPLIGDRPTDLELARRMGCTPMLVRTGHGTRTERLLSRDTRTRDARIPVFDDLAAAADFILGS